MGWTRTTPFFPLAIPCHLSFIIAVWETIIMEWCTLLQIPFVLISQVYKCMVPVLGVVVTGSALSHTLRPISSQVVSHVTSELSCDNRSLAVETVYCFLSSCISHDLSFVRVVLFVSLSSCVINSIYCVWLFLCSLVIFTKHLFRLTFS